MDNQPSTLIARQLHRALENDRMSILHARPEHDATLDFACSTVAGLSELPRHLDCRFLYDAQGSQLFDRITEQPEYYLTRTEAALLAEHADSIREIVGPVTLTELGSGNSTKSDLLLRAWLSRGNGVRYVPVDVSETALTCACKAIRKTHREVQVVGVNCEYMGAFPLLRELSPVLVLFLGSSIGNFCPQEMDCFLGSLSASLTSGDFFLLGVDLAKEGGIIEAAYNDAAGVTARFTTNIFARMNRELGASINLKSVRHVAEYIPQREQVEIYARFMSRQSIEVMPLERSFQIDTGERIRVEICRKFCLERFVPYLKRFGFQLRQVYTDPKRWFALLLLRRIEHAGPMGRVS